ncbi:MAG: hypothetical protein JO052_25865 [Bradyrhizobium sp.]|nr:hypothetical protein [Bradyrhizobium sp.]
MARPDQIWDFLQRLTPLTRSCLLAELERLELCGVDMPNTSDIQAKLRAEFRKDGTTQNRATPSRYFFAPLEPLLVDGAPEHANSGRIARGSLTPIWEWICHDLLRTMARDYNTHMKDLIAGDRQREAQQAAAAFQVKVVKSLEGTLGTPDGAAQARARLAAYTASPAVHGDLTKILVALRAREALAKFNDALPTKLTKFDDAQVAKVMALLDSFAKKNADAVAFALALVALRLRTPWQLIRLATKAARSKKAVDVAATPYAIAVAMVLDRLEDKRLVLRLALKHNRVLIARDTLTEIYDTEYALQVRIDEFDASDWGQRLHDIMDTIAALVEAEVSRFPDEVGHVLGSRSLRHHQSFGGRLTYLAWKGRDAITDSVSFCKGLIGQS